MPDFLYPAKALADIDKRLRAVEKKKLKVKDLPISELRTKILEGEPNDPTTMLLPGAIIGELLSPDLINNLVHYAKGDGELVVDFGETTVTYTAAEDSAETEVAHDLGVEPSFVVVEMLEAAGSVLRTGRVTSKNSQTFKFQFNAEAVLTRTDNVMWFALGLK